MLLRHGQGGHKVGEKISWVFQVFPSHNYTFPEVIATKILAIWQHLGWFLSIFSPCMRKNSYFSWHLLGRVATPWDHDDPVYPVNSCFTQIFNHTKTILFVIVFPWGCTEFPENSMSFPGSKNFLSIPGFSRFVATMMDLKSYGCKETHGVWEAELQANIRSV